ncbi:hypothetical protein [Sphingomonas crusticola]|uniref:hypothetical protein n=1 Tax=Sphingomonas crusticola TaxID=1697973 RepID=UPI0013C2EC87|nr:hypothetical protein [Sphingomonas crusticola]
MAAGDTHSKIVCLGPPKEAALYFDRVFPIDLGTPSFVRNTTVSQNGEELTEEMVEELLENYVPKLNDPRTNSVISSLFRSDIKESRVYVEHTIASFGLLMLYIAAADKNGKFLPRDKPMEDHLSKVLDVSFSTEINKARRSQKVTNQQRAIINKALDRMIIESGFSNSPIWDAQGISMLGKLSHSQENASQEEDGTFFNHISGLNLVDINKTPWEMIVEFRNDSESRAALRDLRLFFSENLQGKSSSEIEDTLLSKIYHHDKVVSAWKFQTINNTIGVAFSKESTFSSAAAGILASFGGAPLSAAAGTALAVTLGSCVVEIGKSLLSRNRAHYDNPIRYLTNMKERLHNP